MDALSHLLLAFILGQALRLDGNLQLILIVSSIGLDVDGISTSPEAAFRTHRGPIHSVLAALLASATVSVGYAIFMRLQTTAFLSVIPITLIGFFSHLVLDLLTTGNMTALWPFSKRNFALNLTHYIDPTNLGALTAAALLSIYATDVATDRIVVAASIAFLTASFGLRLYMKQAATNFIKSLDTDDSQRILALPTLRPDRWWTIRKTPFENGYSYETYRIEPVQRRILSKNRLESPYTSYSAPVEPPIDSPQKAVAHSRRDKRVGGSIERFVLPKADVTSSSDGKVWQVVWYDAFRQANKEKRRGIVANIRSDGTIAVDAHPTHEIHP